MIDPVHRATLFAMYQLSVVLGIVLMPVAMLTSRVGVPLPMHKLISRLEASYDDARRTSP